MEKPVCKLIGENGNIFNLLAIATSTLRRAGQNEKVKEMVSKATTSSSYDEALNAIGEFVEIV